MVTKRTKNGNVSLGIISIIVLLLIAIIVGFFFLREGKQKVYKPKRVAKRVKIEVPPPPLEPDKDIKQQISQEVELEKEEEKEILPSHTKPEEKPTTTKEETTKPPVVSSEKKKKSQVVKKIAKTPKEVKNRWVINVASTPSENDAHRFLEKFKKGGYKGYVSEFNYKNKLWYRVRIGFFASRADAKRVGEILSLKYLLKSYWVVKASTDEIRSHRK